MSFEYTNKWQVVKNTVSDRTLDNSLLHTLTPGKKIKKQTKFLNQKLKKSHFYVRSYKYFLTLKRQVERACPDGDETDDEPGLSYEEYKKIHNDKKKEYQSQNSLEFGTRTKTREYSEQTKRTSPIHKSEKSSKSPTVKRPDYETISKADDSKHGVKSAEKTSVSNSGNGQSKLSQTESQPSQTKLSNTRQITHSFNEKNVNCNDIRKDNNAEEKKCIHRIVQDLLSGSIDKQSIDEALKSDSEKVEVNTVKDSSIVGNLSAELIASEPEHDVTDELGTCLDNDSVLSNDEKQDNCKVITDVADDLNKSNSVLSCEEVSIKENRLSQEDIMTNDNETFRTKENLSTENNNKRCMDNLNDDSGNNSLSDTDLSRTEYGKNSNDELKPYEYHDAGLVTECSPSINNEEIIASDTILGLEKNVIKLNGAENTVGLNDKLMENRELSDGNSHSEPSEKVKLSIGGAANHRGSKLAIRTIEHCGKGYEIFSKHTLLEEKTLKTVNNFDHKFIEKQLPSAAEQPLDSRKSSGDCFSSHNESQHSNEPIDHDDSMENKSSLHDEQSLGSRISCENGNLPQNESQYLDGLLDQRDSSLLFRSNQENSNSSFSAESILEDEKQIEGNESSKECNISEVGPDHLNRSLNSSFSSFCARSYDEHFKNCVKTQLLSEIEQRLRDTPSSKKNSSSHTCSEISNGSSNDEAEKSLLFFNSDEDDVEDKSIDDQSLKEDDTQAIEDDDSHRESSSLKITKSSSYRTSDIEDSLLSLKPSIPTKRRNSINVTDHCSLEDTPRSSKLPRLHEAATKGHSKLSPRECRPQKAVPEESQPEKNRKDSHDQDNHKQNTSKNVHHTPKRKPRPRNLESFVATETLTQDTMKPHFRLNDIGDDDEIWIMDIPRTIDPRDLEDRTILLGGKSELKFGDDCYRVSSKPAKRVRNVSCIFATSRKKKQYKIANVESKGTIKFRQQFSVNPETKLISPQVAAVPFPKNLKIRHPLFGASYEDKI